MTSIPGQRFIGFGAVAILLVVICWLADTLFFLPMRDQEQQLVSLHNELDEVSKRRAVLDGELQMMRRSPALAPGRDTFTSADTSTTAAEIQQRVRGLTADVGGILLSSQAGADEAVGDNLVRLQVLVRARFSEDGLFRFLNELEVTKPPVLLKALEVTAGHGPADQPALDFAGVLVAFHTNAS